MKNSARFLLAAVVLLGAGAVSQKANGQAQATATGPGSYVTVGGAVSAFQEDYGKRVIGGGTAFVDMNPTWRYGIEAEGRWLRYNTDQQVTETNYLVGPRVSVFPGPFEPYVKFLVGDGHIVLPFNYASGDFFTFAPGGGVDYMVSDRWTVRGDFEYQKWTDFPYGELRPYGVSLGVSFRVNGLSRYPKSARHMRR